MAETQLDQDPDRHTFLPGNKWRFKPGTSGSVARYKPKTLEREADTYLSTLDETKRPTWSGLAAHLGITTRTLDRYKSGEIGSTKAVKAANCLVLEYYGTLMESWLEQSLTDKDFATVGIKHALNNQFSDRWSEKREISVTNQQDTRLIVQLSPELTNKLQQAAGESLDFKTVEGEHETVENNDV